MERPRDSDLTKNLCWVLDLSSGSIEGKKFKGVTPFTVPFSSRYAGLGNWDRFVYLTYTYNYIYDPLLTSAPLFEESNSNLYE